MIYGYARELTEGQGTAAQVRALKAAGASKLVRDGASGDRAQLRKALEGLEAGDVLMVTGVGCLARSTRELLNALVAVAGKKAGFKSLGEPWANTTTAQGRVVLTVLGGLAAFERELMRARTSEGQARAMARGVKMGRKPKLTERQQREATKRRNAGEALRDIALSYNVSHSTISRLP